MVLLYILDCSLKYNPVKFNNETNKINTPFNLVVFSGALLNGIAFEKLDRIVNPVKKTFLTNLNKFIYTISFFFIKYL